MKKEKFKKRTSWMDVLVVFFILSAFFTSGFSAGLFAQQHVQAQLVSEVESVKPGSRFSLAVKLTMEEGWHTYWKNPGDSGLATTITWQLPEGFKAGEIQWPYPQRFETSQIMSFGYEGSVFLIVPVKVPDALKPGRKVMLSARVGWLACKEECVTGREDVSIQLPVKETVPEANQKWAQYFIQTRRNLPQISQDWEINAAVEADKILIQMIPVVQFAHRLKNIVFFPEQKGVVEYSEPQNVKRSIKGYILEVKRSELTKDIPARLKGVLFSPEGWDSPGKIPALRVDVLLQ